MTLTRTKIFWAFLLGVGLLRLVTLGMYPLLDTTEARYGEIARIMVDTGNWLVPQIDYGTVFWGKPPLSFWASALSIELFHNSEFFLRLPHLLAAIAVLLLIWRLALVQGFTRMQANASMAIVATNIGFLITAGSVMTDMMLCLSMTLTMVGFWRGWHGERRFVYLMYAGLGIGLLAKGPIIVVFAGLALFPWLVATCGIKDMWPEVYHRLKPVSGLLLTMLIALPWYVLMERASPGFLKYFIVGEHFQRFIDSGWRGDL
ncbi:MAG TPA: phospholipid carrier-dependent glycosyltransferase, partial [Gammaproteobacteria bacterium]|nr:phospholipid carrier-dependent glycosyltransferase [Gammaproteobacteria bacterium]